MKSFALTLLIATTAVARADTNGPYEGVPDLKGGENPMVFSIPKSTESLRFYVSHMPQLVYKPKSFDAESYKWVDIAGCYATFRVLGHVRGRRLYELRYVGDDQLRQGLDYAESIVILGLVERGENEGKLEAIYFTTATNGTAYDLRAEYAPSGDTYGAIVVAREYSGTSPFTDRIGIRGTEDFGFERFNPKAEQAGAGQPATRSESDSEGDQKPQPESEGRYR